LRSCYKSQKRICAKERQNLSVVKSRERRSIGVCEGSIEKEIYQAIKITTDVTSVFCAKERWEEENGTGLSISEQ